MDFSITSLLSNLSDAAQPASKKKSKKTKKAVVEDVVVDAAASEGPDSAVELAAAFGSTTSATAPVLAPATFLNGSKKRKYSIDELLGDDAGSINEDEDRREMSGTQSKSAKKRAIKRDSAERLKRTVFLGNLAATITAKQVKRLMASVLAGQKGSLDSMLGKTAPAAAASAPADDDDELSEGEEPEKDLDDLLEEDVSDDDEAGGAAPLPPGARARIESVRLRSLPISGTPVASGSDYKAMRKV